MIIKTFRANTSAAALKQVRHEMGGEAVVLKTTTLLDENNLPMVEITACLERPTVAQSSRIFADKEETSNQIEETTEQPEVSLDDQLKDIAVDFKEVVNRTTSDDELSKQIQALEGKLNSLLSNNLEIKNEKSISQVKKVLEQHDIDSDTIEKIDTYIAVNSFEDDDLMQLLEEELTKELSAQMIPSFELNHGDSVAVVGIAGSGKSSVLGKLAASLVIRDKKKIRLKTLDDFKMAAFDEIAAYGEILNSEFDNSEQLDKKDDEICLIDTPALPFDEKQFSVLQDKLNQINPTYVFAVVSAMNRRQDIELFASNIRKLHPTHLIITMTDLTRSRGALFNAPAALGVKTVYTSDSPGGLGQLKAADPGMIAREITSSEVVYE